MELGTASRLQVLQALRADQWLALHPQAPSSLRREIKQRMRNAFYLEADDWKRNAVERTTAAVRQALQGLTVR